MSMQSFNNTFPVTDVTSVFVLFVSCSYFNAWHALSMCITCFKKCLSSLILVVMYVTPNGSPVDH